MNTPNRPIPTRQVPVRPLRAQPGPKRSSPVRTVIAVLLMVGCGVGGYAWYRHRPTPVARPAADEAPPAADDTPPPPRFAAGNANGASVDYSAQSIQVDPAQLQAMMQQNAQQMTAAMYGDLFAQMNLTPEQQTQVDALMAQRTQAVQAVFQNLFQQGGFDPSNVNPAQILPLVDQAQAQANQGLQAVLGDANYQQLQARDQQLRQNFQAGGFGGPGGPGGAGGPGGPGP